MKYYLYKFSDNWADEMDLEGFAILTETEKDIALAKIRKEYKNGGTICFGTNEDNEYDSLSEVMATVSFKEIAAVEYNAIRKAFGTTHMGETGPLDAWDLDGDEDDEVEYCDHCAGELDEEGVCTNCEYEDDDDKYEEQYNAQANAICKFIKSEYGLEETVRFDFHSNFVWKPTPSTEIHITIANFDDGEEEVELHLKFKGKDVRYEFLKVEDIWNNPGAHLRQLVKELIEKAKKY
jgi:hypothetical protein